MHRGAVLRRVGSGAPDGSRRHPGHGPPADRRPTTRAPAIPRTRRRSCCAQRAPYCPVRRAGDGNGLVRGVRRLRVAATPSRRVLQDTRGSIRCTRASRRAPRPRPRCGRRRCATASCSSPSRSSSKSGRSPQAVEELDLDAGGSEVDCRRERGPCCTTLRGGCRRWRGCRMSGGLTAAKCAVSCTVVREQEAAARKGCVPARGRTPCGRRCRSSSSPIRSLPQGSFASPKYAARELDWLGHALDREICRAPRRSRRRARRNVEVEPQLRIPLGVEEVGRLQVPVSRLVEGRDGRGVDRSLDGGRVASDDGAREAGYAALHGRRARAS